MFFFFSLAGNAEEEKQQGSLLVEGNKFDAILFFEAFSAAYPSQWGTFYSLGRAYYDIHAWDLAIIAFEKSLKLKPKNPDAELLMAYALMFKAQKSRQKAEGDLRKSEELFQYVLKQVPSYREAEEGLKAVKKKFGAERPEVIIRPSPKKIAKVRPKKVKEEDPDASYLSLAKELSSQSNYAGAAEIYSYLSEKSPKNPEYLFFLGREYRKAGCRCLAKEMFERSLEIKPDYSDSLIYLGKYYFEEKKFCMAKELFTAAIIAQPKDVAGYIGLARVEALLDNPEDAEELFEIAYEMEPDNTDILGPFGAFFLEQRRYTEAEALYRIYAENNDDFEKYRALLFDTTSYTTPSFFARAGTAEEREKDIFTHKWVASLRYYTADIGFIFPVHDRLRFMSRMHAGTTRQRLLQSQRTQFNVKSVGGGVKAEWIFNLDWTLIADLGMEWIANNHKPVILPTKRGTKLLPTLVLRYAKRLNTVVFGEIADTIIFRDFKKQHVRVVTRNAAIATYQRDFEDYRYFGMDAAWIWYEDPIHNQEQDALIWVQTGIPYIEDLLSLRYQCEYRHFNHEVSGYYSFQYQLTHWLKLRLIKKWDLGTHYEMEYWHGWRTTRGKNPQQQIVVTPILQDIPVTTVANQIDQVFVTFGYMPDDTMDFNIVGTYYHDSFDYTIMGAKIQWDWRF